jgi:hypothetical protein
MKKILFNSLKIFLFLTVFCVKYSFSKDKEKEKKDTVATVKPPKKKKPFDDSLKSYKIYAGLFKIYQDTTKGNSLMVIRKDQIDKEFIYFSYSENGPVNVQGFRGNFRDNKVFTIRKYFDKIEFVAINTSFYFNPKSELSQSADANISPSVLVSKKIMDTDNEKGEYLINADDIFISEVLHRVKPLMPKGVPSDAIFSLGGLSKDKSKLLKIRNYPKNTDVLVEYVFENPYPSVGGGAEVTDERNVSVQIQHTLIEMPQNTYKPRFDDQRVGYFTTLQNDMTSISATNYRDFIHRWNLQKKDSLAEVSEPKQPIVWWIEKTTPKEFRPTIKKAALLWNLAFEKAGFKNALQIYEQPDTAKWDAGDIRYNVLRWTSSPSPIFGGYGPSFVNPRTGEILGADIMLEYVFVTNRLKQEKLFDRVGVESKLHTDDKHAHFCEIDEYLHQEVLFGKLATQMLNAEKADVSEFIDQSLYYLVLHELGHTLGLNHNMKASQLWSPLEINDKNKTSERGITASVMDYPAVNIAVDKSKQGYYFTTKPGVYDLWAIEFGYKQFADSTSEKMGLETILNRSIERELAFGNDADDMRAAGVHIDPRVMINDLSSDAIGYMTDRLKLTTKLAANLMKRYVKNGESYHELRNAYLMLTAEQANSGVVISRYVGGIYVERALAGQNAKLKPFTPVKYEDQKRAMQAIATYIFASDAFKVNSELYNFLQLQRRGFAMFGQNEDPKIHDRVLNSQKAILDHWLHPNVLKRLTDSELYGNKYSVSECLGDLTDAIFKADMLGIPNTFRQNLQIEYVSRLASVIKNDSQVYDYIAKATIVSQLKKLQKQLELNKGTSPKVQAHREYLLFLIQKALVVK